MKPNDPENKSNRTEYQRTEESENSLIEFNLSMSIEERLDQHERARQMFEDLIQAGKEVYGELKQPAEDSPQK
jgi:hypothetical protein